MTFLGKHCLLRSDESTLPRRLQVVDRLLTIKAGVIVCTVSPKKPFKIHLPFVVSWIGKAGNYLLIRAGTNLFRAPLQQLVDGASDDGQMLHLHDVQFCYQVPASAISSLNC